jgi:GT2 family glycosyltransferase
MSVEITVIVPTLNRAHWLEECLASVLSQETREEFDFEVLVIDNGSTDDTAELLGKLAAENTRLRWLQELVRSESRARNAGIRESRGNWLAFLDDDELAEPDWLWNLLIAARTQQVKIVGGAVHLPQTAQQQLHPWTREILAVTCQNRSGPYSPRTLPATGNVLVHWSVIEQIGGFDQAFTLGSDTEFFHRATCAGLDRWFCYEAGVYHRTPEDRLATSHLLPRASWQGEKYVEVMHRDGGAQLLFWAAIRALYTIVRHGGGLVVSALLGDEATRLGHLIRIWRFVGFLRGTARRFVRAPEPAEVPRFQRPNGSASDS